MEKESLTSKNKYELAQKAADYLNHGYAIIFPTDTLYALGVDATSKDAINLFFSIKKRPVNKPAPIFVRDIKMAHSVAHIDKRQEEILKKLWPGAFTVVLYKRDVISKKLTAQSDKIGIRIPDNEFTKLLLDTFKKPITSSSANISGMPAFMDIENILKQLKTNSALPEFVVSVGELKPNEPSTVVDITKNQPKILRINQTTLPKMQKVFESLNIIK